MSDHTDLPPSDTPSDPAAERALRLQQKRSLLENSLERGRTQIRVDTRRAGVRVPEHLEGQHELALNLSWRFPSEMLVNERGVAATLRFGGVPFRCQLPWAAIWGIHPPNSDLLHVFPTDLPPELGGPPRDAEEAEPPPIEPVKPRLAVLRSAAPPPEPEAAAPAETPEPAPEAAPEAPPRAPEQRAPWLKLVK